MGTASRGEEEMSQKEGRKMYGSDWTGDSGSMHSVLKCDFCEKFYCQLHQSETCPHRFYDE